MCLSEHAIKFEAVRKLNELAQFFRKVCDCISFMDETSFSSISSQQYGIARNTLRPVTIRQLLSTQFEETFSSSSSDRNKYRYRIDGHEFGSATLVASVISAEDGGEQKRCWLEDGTGRLVAWQWISNNEIGEQPESKEPAFHKATYVRVYGKPDKWNHAISFKIDHIRPINDVHEVYFHIMESIVATLQYTRGPPPRIHESSSARAPVYDLSASFRRLSLQSSVTRRASPPPASLASSSSSSSSFTSSTSEDDPLPRDGNDDQSEPATEDSSDDSLYMSTSEHADDEDELEDLRRELDAPSTPPQHTHHALCMCPDKPGNLRTPQPTSSNTTVVSPARPLSLDPYWQLTSLERNIILHIHMRQNQGGDRVDISSIGQAAILANPSDATPRTVNDAVERLLREMIIETTDDQHFRITQRAHRLYPDL